MRPNTSITLPARVRERVKLRAKGLGMAVNEYVRAVIRNQVITPKRLAFTPKLDGKFASVRLSVKVPEEIAEAVFNLAKRNNVSVSSWVCAAVELDLETGGDLRVVFKS